MSQLSKLGTYYFDSADEGSELIISTWMKDAFPSLGEASAWLLSINQEWSWQFDWGAQVMSWLQTPDGVRCCLEHDLYIHSGCLFIFIFRPRPFLNFDQVPWTLCRTFIISISQIRKLT